MKKISLLLIFGTINSVLNENPTNPREDLNLTNFNEFIINNHLREAERDFKETSFRLKTDRSGDIDDLNIGESIFNKT